VNREEILREAMALTLEEREMLAEELFKSVASAEQKQIDAAWAAEIERRIDDLDSGRMTARPAEDVLREARERLERRQSSQ
jgi:putative addiction module component (TIGR02574 family)